MKLIITLFYKVSILCTTSLIQGQYADTMFLIPSAPALTPNLYTSWESFLPERDVLFFYIFTLHSFFLFPPFLLFAHNFNTDAASVTLIKMRSSSLLSAQRLTSLFVQGTDMYLVISACRVHRRFALTRACTHAQPHNRHTLTQNNDSCF